MKTLKILYFTNYTVLIEVTLIEVTKLASFLMWLPPSKTIFEKNIHYIQA